MARKSRKQRPGEAKQGCVPIQEEARPWRAALYARLSVEDVRKRESGSIGNQIALLERYAASQPDIQAHQVYADRGESGANFDRPEFRRMMEDVRAGAVNCVIVKDLSRFGRNHIEAGGYLEQVFPFLGVRFISVNDRFDTAALQKEGTPLVVPLKNLINELYARDISRKVTSQFAVKQQKGEFLGAFAPYGYLRSPEDRHRLEPDPEAAPVVREIFRWRLEGLGPEAIAGRLSRAGVPAPGRHRYELGLMTARKFAEESRWHKSAVRRILQNPVYLGHMAQARQKTSIFWGGVRQERPRELWVTVPDTHPALVDEETFRRAQRTGKGG